MSTPYDQLFQVVLKVDYDTDNPYYNTFYYGASGLATITNENLEDLGLAFLDVFPDVLDRLFPDVASMTQVVVNALYEPALIYDNEFNIPGVVPDAPAPGFTAVSFRTERVRRDIRRGQKRFSPIADNVPLGEGINPAWDVYMLELATTLGMGLNGGPIGTAYTPVVVKRIAYTSPSGKPAYRLPNNDLEAETFDATNWNVVGVTTQNSRKD